MTGDAAGWTPDRMIQRFGGDEALVRELVSLFLTEQPHLLQALRTAVESGRPARVRTAAHALKGCVGNFTDTGAFMTAYDIERKSAGGRLEDLPALLTALSGELDDIVARMRDFEASTSCAS